jgi:hypothetical protein
LVVDRLVLVSTTCGGKDSTPPSPQLIELGGELVNKFLNNIPVLCRK